MTFEKTRDYTETSSAEPVLVTGASGFIGGAIVKELVKQDRLVYGLTRTFDQAERIEELGAEPVIGNYCEPDTTLKKKLGKCAVVYHIAGVNGFGKNEDELYDANYHGVGRFMRAIGSSDVGKVVFASSAVTTDDTKTHSGKPLSKYALSKILGEEIAIDKAQAAGFDLICLNPASVQGPGRIGGTARILINYLNGKSQLIPNGTVSILDINDAVTGFLQGEHLGLPGKRYILAGATLELKDFLHEAEETAELKGGRIFTNKALIGTVSGLSELVAKISGNKPALPWELARTIWQGTGYDGSAASEDLDFEYTPLAETMQKTINWYREQGYIPTVPDRVKIPA